MPQRDRLPTLLVVDSDRITADGLVHVLQENSFQACACYSAQSALSAADLQQPDLAIIEVVLPDLDGVHLARRIQLLSPRTQILLMCGCPEAAGPLDTCEFEVVIKPISPSEVVAKLRALTNSNSGHRSEMPQAKRRARVA
jgi:two-component system OmpR family response regulator